ISFGSAGPAETGAPCAASRPAGAQTKAAARPAPAVRKRRRAISCMPAPPPSPALRDVVPGQVDGLGEPDVLLAEHVLDQPLEHAHPRRAAHDLRMEHQVEEAALL